MMNTHVDTNSLAERVKQYFWFHSIDLGNGVVTPGTKSPEIHASEAAAFFDPIKMSGATVIDIGAWNGFYSFEAKRRGASRVLATDHYCWNHKDFRGRETFELARSALGLDIEAIDIDVIELYPERLGTFDVAISWRILSFARSYRWTVPGRLAGEGSSRSRDTLRPW
jgi:tRNA (mo5U34)-methyltransferase